MQQVWPLPELLNRGAWAVVEPDDIDQLNVCSDIAARLMYAPTGDNDEDRGRRMHELAHAAITPEGAPGGEKINRDILNVVEDMRINYYMNRVLSDEEKGLPLNSDDLRELARQVWKMGKHSTRIAAMAGVAMVGTPALPEFLRHYHERMKIDGRLTEYNAAVNIIQRVSDKFDDCLNRRRRGVPRGVSMWQDTLETALYMQLLLNPFLPDGNNPGADGDILGGNPLDMLSDEALEALLDELGKAAKEEGMDPGEFPPEKVAELLHKNVMEYDDQGAVWGELEIVEGDLTKIHTVRHSVRKMKPREQGDALRYIYRDEDDGKVFGQPRRAKGGTILVDDSGSMGMPPQHIAAIIAAAPNCTIAQYAGNGDRGKLRIIARFGKSVEDHDASNPDGWGGNIVDGPALEWLAKQRRPLLWVSDGHVTGKNESRSTMLLTEANLIVTRNKIKRIGTPQLAVELLEKGLLR